MAAAYHPLHAQHLTGSASAASDCKNRLREFEQAFAVRNASGAAAMAPELIRLTNAAFGKKPEDGAPVLAIVGLSLGILGEFEASGDVWLACEQFASRVPEWDDTTLHAIGRQLECNLKLGDYGQAADTYDRAIQFAASRKVSPVELSHIFQYRGNWLAMLGQESAAIASFQKAIAYMTEGRQEADLTDEELSEYAKTYLFIVAAQLTSGDYHRARENCMRGRSLLEQKVLDPGAIVGAIGMMAKIDWSIGDLVAAESQFKDAVVTSDKFYAQYKLPNLELTRMTTRIELGAFFSDIGRLEEADSILTVRGVPVVGESSVALLRARQGRWEEWEDLTAKSLRTRHAEFRDILPLLSEPEQLQYMYRWGGVWHGFNRLLGVIDQPAITQIDAERVFECSLNFKGAIQETLALAIKLARSQPDSKLGELLAIRSRLAHRSLLSNDLNMGLKESRSANDASFRSLLTQKSDDDEAREQSLQRSVFLDVLPESSARKWLDTQEVRAALPPDAVFVDFIKIHYQTIPIRKWQQSTEERYLASVVWPNAETPVKLIDLGDSRQIDQLVAKVRKAIEKDANDWRNSVTDLIGHREESVKAELRTLSKSILDPLGAEINGARLIILSPDDELWRVPWAALVTEKGKFLIENDSRELVTTTSGRDLIRPPHISTISDKSCAVFGNPSFDLNGEQPELIDANPTEARASPLVGPFPQLTGSKQEVKRVTNALELRFGIKVCPKVGDEATEGNAKLVRRPQVFVLSTHAAYSVDKRLEPNPLLRCGLALAGANHWRLHRNEDGILTGAELALLDLQGTELTVLSACETAVGEARSGEGIACLQQACQLAGSELVLGALWRVPDDVTGILVSQVIEKWTDGRSIPASLSQTQRQSLKKASTRHPFFWSGIVLSGAFKSQP